MNKVLIAIPILALLTLGAVFIAGNHKSHNLTNSSNVTTFTKFRTCTSNLKYLLCQDFADETERNLCYAAAYGVSRLTFSDGDLLTESCKNFIAYEATAKASDVVNANNYYFSCFLSGDVLKQAYQSQSYYEQIYSPRQITCAGY